MATDTGSWPGGYSSCEMGNSKNVFVKVTNQASTSTLDTTGMYADRQADNALAPCTLAASSNEVCTWATWPTMMRDWVGTLVARYPMTSRGRVSYRSRP